VPDLDLLRQRRIAHADVRAALGGDLERQLLRIARDRDPDRDLLAVGLDGAEELVLLDLAFRELRRAERRAAARDREAELVAVHVVAVGDLEPHLDGGRVERSRRQPERLLRL